MTIIELHQLAISDGCIEATCSSLDAFVLTFRDWQGKRWKIAFYNVIGVENFNIEGEELDGVAEEQDSDLLARARNMATEPTAPIKCYAFRSAWSDDPRLRIVATHCDAREIAVGNTALP